MRSLGDFLRLRIFFYPEKLAKKAINSPAICK